MNLRVHNGVGSLSAAEWNACAGPDNPFVSHEFFRALEESGTACARTGWLPQHLSVGDPALAVLPLYVKAHSEGEFIFDYGWADAYERAGGRYYPKLQVCVPYSPVPGPRLLIRPDAPRVALEKVFRVALRDLVDRVGASSAHVTFCTGAEQQSFPEPWLPRTTLQYHWSNAGYAGFDDFLAALMSRKRKAIKKERAEAHSYGLRFEALSGDELTPVHWDAFFRFYQDTSGRKWGRAALTRGFFTLLHELLRDRVVLMLASLDGRPVAGALNLRGTEALFGRNWGCLDYFPSLHFELCYYQAIDYALAHGLARVEAGAQGRHKIARGYLPVYTYSAHYIHDPAFRGVLKSHLAEETRGMERERVALLAQSPFRQE